MSNPQQKADELIEKMYNVYTKDGIYSMRKEEAVKCAIIAVEEIILALESFCYSGAMYDCFYTGRIETTEGKLPTDFWHEVLTILK